MGENNSSTDFFDSPQVQQSQQAAQWSATDSAHSLQQQDQLRSRVGAADQLATSNDQLTVANDQLTASNQQLAASNSQLEVEVADLRERLALNESRLTELGQELEEKR